MARWLANRNNVGRSLHRACDTVPFDASAHNGTVATQSGVYRGTFFCMNGACPESP
jgi:hypothetical protein